MRAAVAICLLASASQAFDIRQLMQIQAMQSRFSEDKLDGEQQKAMMNLAGFEDVQLFYSGAIELGTLKQSMKQQFKDQMIQNLLTNGGLDITNPFIRKKLFGDRSTGDFFAQGMAEPLQTILRLARHDDMDPGIESKVRAFGKDLLKKFQFKSMNNKNGNAIEQNIDRIFTADNKKEMIKKIMKEQFLQNIADPIDRAMVHFMQKKRTASGGAEQDALADQIKDMQIIKVLSSSTPNGSPVQPDNMYAFYRMVHGKLQPHQILDIALNSTKLGPVSELDFERYFGAPAKQFSCKAHDPAIRIPCGVRPTAEECIAQGCCWNPPDSSAGMAPTCFHDLFGKISSSILRQEYIKSNSLGSHIKGLFVGDEIPTIQQLMRDEDPVFQMGLIHTPGTNPDGSPSSTYSAAVEDRPTNWWDVSTVDNSGEQKVFDDDSTASNTANLWDQGRALTRPKYGRPGYRWQPHGPTVSPYLNSVGVNPTANPSGGTGDMDEYYKLWLKFSAKQDEAQCALISKDSRIKCMDNFEYLKSRAQNVALGPDFDECNLMGCCYNEDAFLEGGHACYRARDYGSCANLPGDFNKRTCGVAGVSETECLSDARCCYEPSAEHGVPWCYYRYSATFTEDEWCDAFKLPEHKFFPRDKCFDTQASVSSNILNDGNGLMNVNNLVSQDVCEQAGCCYDDSLTKDAIEWQIEGLDVQNVYRCFRKRNPAAAGTSNLEQSKIWDMRQKLLNHDYEGGTELDADGNPNAELATFESNRVKTCTVDDWSKTFAMSKIPRSCGDNVSYHQCVYQLGCCYKPTVTNQPVCYHPDYKAANAADRMN